MLDKKKIYINSLNIINMIFFINTIIILGGAIFSILMISLFFGLTCFHR